MFGRDLFLGLDDAEAHLVELAQEIVREFQVGLVDLIDQQDMALLYVPEIVAFLGYDPFGPPPASSALRLKMARIAAGLTRRQLAARLDVHPETVAEWERGQRRPLLELRKRLQTCLRTPPEPD